MKILAGALCTCIGAKCEEARDFDCYTDTGPMYEGKLAHQEEAFRLKKILLEV